MLDDVRQLRDVADPVERARKAGELLGTLQAGVTELSRLRREAVEEALSSGLSHAELASALGMSRGRISQLMSSGPPPERAFFGTDTLTVAIGGKRDADNPDRPAVAQEDFAAYQRLSELATSLRLKTTHEFIQPPGIVRLNRENLVVICGPRLSPLIAQILEADPYLSFERDEAGWYLVDRSTDKVYRSPMDDGVNGDIGYIARLPRPDGRGTFLYIAGIHAMGSSGVINYLERKLPEVYREVNTKRFSALISCEFDAESRAVLASSLVTPLYLHSEKEA